MNVSIIGAAGFLGQTLTRHLAEAGHHIYGFDLADSINPMRGFHYRKLDVSRDVVTIPPKTDVVYYLAQSPFYRDFPKKAEQLFTVNALGAIKAAIAALDRNVRLFCFASTGNVYAPSFSPLSETHPVRRDNAYCLSKIMAEETLKLFQGAMKIVSLRFFGIFGPGQRSMLPVNILKALKNKKPIYLQPSSIDDKDNDGLKVSFTYSLDVARCLEKLTDLSLKGKHLPPKLNVASPTPVSIRKFAETIGAIIGIKPRFRIMDQPREFDLVADVSLLKSIIELHFTSFENSMSSTYKV